MLAERRHVAYREMADQQIMEVIRTMMTISSIKAPSKDIDDDDVTQLSSDEEFAPRDSDAMFMQAHTLHLGEEIARREQNLQPVCKINERESTMAN